LRGPFTAKCEKEGRSFVDIRLGPDAAVVPAHESNSGVMNRLIQDPSRFVPQFRARIWDTSAELVHEIWSRRADSNR
jgi:hypothetical protein